MCVLCRGHGCVGQSRHVLVCLLYSVHETLNKVIVLKQPKIRHNYLSPSAASQRNSKRFSENKRRGHTKAGLRHMSRHQQVCQPCRRDTTQPSPQPGSRGLRCCLGPAAQGSSVHLRILFTFRNVHTFFHQHNGRLHVVFLRNVCMLFFFSYLAYLSSLSTPSFCLLYFFPFPPS